MYMDLDSATMTICAVSMIALRGSDTAHLFGGAGARQRPVVPRLSADGARQSFQAHGVPAPVADLRRALERHGTAHHRLDCVDQ